MMAVNVSFPGPHIVLGMGNETRTTVHVMHILGNVP
jgi:hypothetical protein